MTPPIHVTAGFGTGTTGVSPTSGIPDNPRGRAIGRLGFSPLPLMKKQGRRIVDPEIGVLFEGAFEPPPGDTSDIGGYLGVGWRMWRSPRIPKSTGMHAFYLRGTADLISRRPGVTIGGGGSLSLGWEFTGFAESAITDNNVRLPAFFGYAYGEGGIGVELAGAGRSFGDATAWQVTFGLTFRIPAVIGLMLLPLPSSK